MDEERASSVPPPRLPVAAAAVGLVAAALAGAAGAAPLPASGPAAVQPDTLLLPRARTPPELDCAVGEWPTEGRVSLSGDEPEVLTARGGGGGSDLTARVHLSWTPDTLYVMTDVRDDRTRPGTEGGGDWIRVDVGTTTVWIPAPGGQQERANTGPRAVGDPVPTSICATEYGWLGEVAVPADRIGGALRAGDLVGLQVLAEDPDREDEDADPPHLRWTDVAVLTAASPRRARGDSVLDRLRRDVTMEELRNRPGARDTTVRLPGGDTVAGVAVEVAGVEALAFADPDRGGDVTYWLEGGGDGAVEELGFDRTVAALHRELGRLQAAEDRERPLFSDVSFELLPGVVFRLGEPAGGPDEVARTAVPTDVFVEAGGGDGG